MSGLWHLWRCFCTMVSHPWEASAGSYKGSAVTLLYVLYSDITAPGRPKSTLSLVDTGLCWGFAGLGSLTLGRLAHWIGGRRRALWRGTNDSDVRVTHEERGPPLLSCGVTVWAWHMNTLFHQHLCSRPVTPRIKIWATTQVHCSALYCNDWVRFNFSNMTTN